MVLGRRHWWFLLAAAALIGSLLAYVLLTREVPLTGSLVYQRQTCDDVSDGMRMRVQGVNATNKRLEDINIVFSAGQGGNTQSITTQVDTLLKGDRFDFETIVPAANAEVCFVKFYNRAGEQLPAIFRPSEGL
jgi:hypothetical protein